LQAGSRNSPLSLMPANAAVKRIRLVQAWLKDFPGRFRQTGETLPHRLRIAP